MRARGIDFQRQVLSPLHYKGVQLGCTYRIDLLVEDLVTVEIKANEGLLPVHAAQLLTYLKLSNKRAGLLLNFNLPTLKEGIKRVVNGFESDLTLRLSPSLSVSASTESPLATHEPPCYSAS